MQAALSRAAGIPLKYANRHGLITGQTGTGKTVSLMRLAESFSSQGVPVFVADVKGDIAALSRSCPATILDVFGETGAPLQVTVSAMGPDLMARALELTDTQAGCLEIAFAAARDQGFAMATLDDLRRVLQSLGFQIDTSRYGKVSAASVSVIMRALLRLEMQGGARFFGNRQFDVADLLDTQGMGIPPCDDPDLPGFLKRGGRVSILDSVRLINSPRVYGAFLLWLLSELWERLPEIGDCDRPRPVMFFDEAHLLFQDCPAALLRRIEQTVRLIRSKGVGVYFVSQSPDDVPVTIRDQLAFRIEHSRQHRVGHAAFSGIDHNGRPKAWGVVRVDLPACDLGALRPEELAHHAPPRVPVERPADARAVAAETAAPPVSSTIAAALILSALALVLWQFDGLAKAAAIGLALGAAYMTTKPG